MWREQEMNFGTQRGEIFTPEVQALGDLRALFRRWQMDPNSPGLKNEVRELAMRVHPDRNPNNTSTLEISKLCNKLLDACRNPAAMGWRQEDSFRGELQNLENLLNAKPPQRPEPKPTVVPPPPPPQPAKQEHYNDWQDQWGGGSWREPSPENEPTPDDSTSNDESWDSTDEKEEETLPYELKEFEITNDLIGKNIFEAKLDLTDDTYAKILKQHYFNKSGYNKYGDYDNTLLTIKVEGIEGVLIAYSNGSDEYRSSFGGWIHVTNLEPKSVTTLGKVTNIDFKQSRRDSEWADGNTNFSEIRMDSGIVIEFGTSNANDYYPRGFAYVSKNKSR